MFGKDDFEEGEKKEWKIENECEWCLVGKGRGRENSWDLASLWAHQNSISPNWRENSRKE